MRFAKKRRATATQNSQFYVGTNTKMARSAVRTGSLIGSSPVTRGSGYNGSLIIMNKFHNFSDKFLGNGKSGNETRDPGLTALHPLKCISSGWIFTAKQ